MSPESGVQSSKNCDFQSRKVDRLRLFSNNPVESIDSFELDNLVKTLERSRGIPFVPYMIKLNSCFRLEHQSFYSNTQ